MKSGSHIAVKTVESASASGAAVAGSWMECGLGLLCLMGCCGILMAQDVPTSTNFDPGRPAPFLRLRETKLDYTGPERDQAESRELKEVKIAWFGPHDLTNHSHSDLWRAASLAISEANERGGYNGLPFRLMPQWSVDPWGTGISQLTRMIYNEEPVAVIGSVDSSSTHLAEQVVAKAQLPLISPISTDKSVTLAGVSWMFACAPTDDAIARVLVNDILAAPNAISRSLVLLSTTDHESRMTVREVLSELRRNRRQPDFRFEFQPGIADSNSQMAAVERARPGEVLIIAGAEDAARLVLAAREHAPEARLFGTHSMGRRQFRAIAGTAAEGVRFPVLFMPDDCNPGTVVFLRQFQNQQPFPPDYTAAFAYDATRLLLAAIQRAGVHRVRLREAIGQLTPWPGVAGPICFDGTGHNTRTNICMGQIRQGAIAPVTAKETNGQSPSKSL